MKSRISKKQFGLLSDGQKITLYSLTNSSGSRVDIMDLGAVITAINVPDRDGEISDIVLGFDNPEQYMTDSPYFGAVVGRYANRIQGEKFSLDDQDYSLTLNDGENSLHGGKTGSIKKYGQWKHLKTATMLI